MKRGVIGSGAMTCCRCGTTMGRYGVVVVVRGMGDLNNGTGDAGGVVRVGGGEWVILYRWSGCRLWC